MDEPTDVHAAQPDLRSRKRSAAIHHIQEIALELFDEHGYDAVSVAQVADAAQVGERSVYRYFGSKPMLLLYDEADTASLEILGERLRTRPLLDAVLDVLTEIAPLFSPETIDHARRRLRHIDQHSELRAALARYIWDLGTAFAAAIADERGVPSDDLTAQIQGRCIVTALSAAVDRWRLDLTADLSHELHTAIEILAAGFGTPEDRPARRPSG